MKVLVLFAHPALERSRVNRDLLGAVRARPGVTFHDLYEEYPDMHVDVAREQALLQAHDVALFQHPFFWYSAPALLKEWQDQVLEHNWAYGAEGRALAGKVTLNVITAGGAESAYQPGGFNRFTVRHLLAPFEATASLCHMTYLAPYVVHGALRMSGAQTAPYVSDYGRLLDALVEDRVDLDRASDPVRLYLDLDQVLRPEHRGPRLVTTPAADPIG